MAPVQSTARGMLRTTASKPRPVVPGRPSSAWAATTETRETRRRVIQCPHRRGRASILLILLLVVLVVLVVAQRPLPATQNDTTSPAFDLVAPYITPHHHHPDHRHNRPDQHHGAAMENDDDRRTIFFITPTYRRATQIVDLVRLSQTLSLTRTTTDTRVYWIVVEDADGCTRRIRDLIRRSGLAFAHVAARDDKVLLRSSSGQPPYSKGVAQRNAALQLVLDDGNVDGVVYFGDDDNAYDVRLFQALRQIRRVGVLPVAYAGGSLYEACQVDSVSGHIVGWHSNYIHDRTYPIDMAGFGFRVSVLREKRPRFRYDWGHGALETKFMEQLVSNVDEIEPLAGNCTEIYVYHVRTSVDRHNYQVHDPLRYRDIAAQV